MAHYGLLRHYRFDDQGMKKDIRGANVYGRNDEKLGKIVDVIFDHSTGVVRYVVVDAGGWFSHKRFLVPPHRLHTAAEHDDDFAVNLDKSQIGTLPRYDESRVRAGERWKRYEKNSTTRPGMPARYSPAEDRITMSPRHPRKCRTSLGRLVVSSAGRGKRNSVLESFLPVAMRLRFSRAQRALGRAG